MLKPLLTSNTKTLLLLLIASLLTCTYTHEQHSSHDHHHHHHSQQQQVILPESQPSERQPDDTDNMMQLSKLIISTIQKYDHTQKGVIPLNRYDEFLHEIFINGNKFNKLNKNKEQVPADIASLLRLATKQFSTFRYSQPVLKSNQQTDPSQSQQPHKKQFVELQEFYMDLIKHFSEFLSLKQYKEKYADVSDYFFVDDQAQKKETEGEKMEL